jgi:Ca-activated chloride channel homolog
MRRALLARIVCNVRKPARIEIIVRRIPVCGVACMFLASLFPSWGQAQTGNLTTIRVTSDLVVIPVTVTDGSGRSVTGLGRDNFELYEDKVKQEITQFASEDSPVSIGFVFDTSGSMRHRIQKAREAVAALLNDANPKDEFFLVQFNSRAQLLAGLTTRTDQIWQQVSAMETGGATALLDAVEVALTEMKNAQYTRKAIVIISDGEDNASRCSLHELKANVRESDVLIYSIGIGDSDNYMPGWWPQSPSGSALLNDIAKQTGGRLFEIHRLKELPGVASKISEWLRHQYVLAFKPSNAGKTGGYRHIEVKITKPDGFPRLHAVWRLGYYAPAE